MKTNPSLPRVIIGANVYVSYLLRVTTTPHWTQEIIESAGTRTFELVVPEELVAELSASVLEKPYLQQHFDSQTLDRLVALLRAIAISVQSLHAPFPAVTRDRRDDYLLAYVKAYDVDFLVTGDKDLLALRKLLDRPQILTVREFLDLMPRNG